MEAKDTRSLHDTRTLAGAINGGDKSDVSEKDLWSRALKKNSLQVFNYGFFFFSANVFYAGKFCRWLLGEFIARAGGRGEELTRELARAGDVFIATNSMVLDCYVNNSEQMTGRICLASVLNARCRGIYFTFITSSLCHAYRPSYDKRYYSCLRAWRRAGRPLLVIFNLHVDGKKEDRFNLAVSVKGFNTAHLLVKLLQNILRSGIRKKREKKSSSSLKIFGNLPKQASASAHPRLSPRNYFNLGAF